MIEETITYSCRSCGSEDIIRNGHNKCSNPQDKCKNCGTWRVLRPKQKYTAEAKETILEAHAERMSLRGLERVFGVWRGTVLRRLPKLSQTLLPAEGEDVLELDECWSYVQQKCY